MVERLPGRATAAVLLLLAAAALWLKGSDTLVAFRPPRTLADFCARDLSQDWLSARAVLNGRSAYAPLRDIAEVEFGPDEAAKLSAMLPYNAHPPTSVLLVIPFAPLDYTTAWVAWAAVTCVTVLLSLAVISRRLTGRLLIWKLLPVSALVATSHPFHETIYHGQFNGLLLLALTLAWSCLSANRGRIAGVLIGLATSVKLFPGLSFAATLAHGRVRDTLLGAACVVALGLISVGVVGASECRRYVVELAPAIQADHGAAWGNQSLPGLWHKLFNPAQTKFVPAYPSRAVERACTVASAAAVLLLIVAVAWFRPAPDRLPGTFVVAVAGAVLLSPVAWNHYFLLLVLPAAWCFSRARWWPAQVLLIASAAVLWVPRWTVWKLVAPGKVHAGVFDVAGSLECLGLAVQTYAVICLLGLTAWVSVYGSRPGEPAGP
jgi:hypothetical protein